MEIDDEIIKASELDNGRRTFRDRLNTRSAAVMLNLGVLLFTNNASLLLVSSLVPVEQAAIWFLCLSLSGFLLIADRGISYPISRHLALQRLEGGNGGRGGKLVRFFLKRTFPSYLATVAILSAYLIVVHFRSDDGQTTFRNLAMLWLLVAAYMFLSMLSKFLQLVNEGLGRLAQERHITSACQLVIFAAGAATVIATHTVWLLPVIYLAGFGVQNLLLYRNIGKDVQHRSDLTIPDMNTIGRESREYWRLAVLNQIVINVQVMSLAFFFDPTSIAPYFFLQKLASGVGKVIGFVVVIDRSEITSLYGKCEYGAVIRTIKRNRMIVFATAALGAAAIFALTYIGNNLNLLRFDVPVTLTLFFLCDVLLGGSVLILGQYLLALGRNPFFYWFLACAILTVALQFILVPLFGSEGAIAAYLLAQLVTTVYANARHFRRTHRELKRALPL